MAKLVSEQMRRNAKKDLKGEKRRKHARKLTRCACEAMHDNCQAYARWQILSLDTFFCLPLEKFNFPF